MHTMTKPAVSQDDIRHHANRALWACGILFGVLLVMGLSGVASITLVHADEQYFGAMRGIEGAVARGVLDLKWLIRATHQYGGYLGVLAAFWAGAEVFRFGRRLRRSDHASWRIKGRRLPILGATGALIVIASLAALTVSGYMASDFLHDRPSTLEELELSTRVDAGQHERDIRPEARPVVDWHTRELNYAMGLGAILLVLCASSVRTVVLEAKQHKRESQETGNSQK